jgi:tetratricopeptide (TPR) repeat protein
MEPEVEDARAAWDWAVERGRLDLLDGAMEGLRLLFWARNRHTEGEAAFRLAAQKLETSTASGEGSVPDRVETLRILARVVSYQALFLKPGPRQQLLSRSLALLDRAELGSLETCQDRAYIWFLMAHAFEQYDRRRAKRLYQRSLALYQEAGEQLDAAKVMHSLGLLAWMVGSYDEAKQRVEEALAIQRALGYITGIRGSLDTLSLIAMYRGRLDEGERLMREAEAIWGGIPARSWWVHFVRGRFGKCLRVLKEQRAIMQDGGTSWVRHRWLCAARVHLGRYEQARADGELAVAFQRASGVPQTIAFALMTLSWAVLAEGAHVEAVGLLEESVALYHSVEQIDEGSSAQASLAYAVRSLGQLDRAREHLCEALHTGTEIGAFFPLMFGLPMAALLLLDRGQIERAVEVYALASRHAFVANSRWFEDVFGRRIAAAAKSLPAEVVAAAQQRGRARDLWETAKELLAELEAAKDGGEGL